MASGPRAGLPEPKKKKLHGESHKGNAEKEDEDEPQLATVIFVRETWVFGHFFLPNGRGENSATKELFVK